MPLAVTGTTTRDRWTGIRAPVTHGAQLDATNTGVLPGFPLTTVGTAGQVGTGWKFENGTFYVETSGAVIEGLDIYGPAKIIAHNVTLRNCRINAASFYNVNVSDPPISYTGLTLENCELYGMDAPSPPTIAVMANAGATYRRCNIHGMGSSGPRLTSDNLIEECYLHSFAHVEPEHEAGTSANDGGTNITIRRSKIVINSGGASNSIGIYRDFPGSSYSNVLIEDNYLAGGSYTLYTAVVVPGAPEGTSVTGMRVIGNVFGRDFHAQSGINGPVAQWAVHTGSEWSGNTWGGGAAATSAHNLGDPVIP